MIIRDVQKYLADIFKSLEGFVQSPEVFRKCPKYHARLEKAWVNFNHL